MNKKKETNKFDEIIENSEKIDDAIRKIDHSMTDINLLQGRVLFFIEDNNEDLKGVVDFNEVRNVGYRELIWDPENKHIEDRKLLINSKVDVKIAFLRQCV